MYLVRRRIRGREYWYLVRSVRSGDRVRQEVVRYVGPVDPKSLPRHPGDRARLLERLAMARQIRRLSATQRLRNMLVLMEHGRRLPRRRQ